MRIAMIQDISEYVSNAGTTCSFDLTASSLAITVDGRSASFSLTDLDRSPHPYSDITQALQPLLADAEPPQRPRTSCGAIVQGDERFCAPCGLRWDVSEDAPDACRARSERV